MRYGNWLGDGLDMNGAQCLRAAWFWSTWGRFIVFLGTTRKIFPSESKARHTCEHAIIQTNK